MTDAVAPARSSASDTFAVPASMRFWGYVCHAFPGVWSAIARFESSILAEQIAPITLEKPIYVTSLARAGTTVLLEVLAQSPGVATHRYKDFPPVLTPYFWNRFLELAPAPPPNPKERAHGDGIMITPDSPEAMEEVVWMSFFRSCHDPRISNLLTRDTQNPAFETFYRNHIRKLLLIRQAKRYLAKGNYNIARLAYIQKLLPDARFVVPVRHPFTHISSLMRQHKRFAAGQKAHPAALAHLRRVGHYEFGLERVPVNMGDTQTIEQVERAWQAGEEVHGWALYWNHVFSRLRLQLDSDPTLAAAVHLIRYEELCARPEEGLANILAHCDLEPPPAAKALAASLREPSYYDSSLDPKDRQTILDICGETLVRYGYPAS